VCLDDRPLISYAIFWHANQEIIKLLIESGAEVNKKNEAAPLLDAIWQNNIEAVKLLLNAGVDLGEKIFGLSYLEHALKKQNPEIIKLLKDSKADNYPQIQLQHSQTCDRLEENKDETIDETLKRVTEKLDKFKI
jgi:ankyrin repeat protein